MWEFQQWEATNNNDSGSESNPSEDEFSPAERKDKVMSDFLTNRKTVSKKKKKKKKKVTPSEKPINRTEMVAIKPNVQVFRNTLDKIESPSKQHVQDSLPIATAYNDKRKDQDDREPITTAEIGGTKYRTGLFRREPRKNFLPPSEQRSKKKSLSNLLPEYPSYGNETETSKQLEPAVQQEDHFTSAGKEITSSNRLLLEYSRKMKTREKLETILGANRLEDRININIGKTVKR